MVPFCFIVRNAESRRDDFIRCFNMSVRSSKFSLNNKPLSLYLLFYTEIMLELRVCGSTSWSNCFLGWCVNIHVNSTTIDGSGQQVDN